MKTISIEEIHRPGMRNIKTAISVFLCLLIARALDMPYPIYACVAAVICTKDTVRNSFKVARDRMVGTVIGGVSGGIFLSLDRAVEFPISFELAVGVGVILVIYLCNLIQESESAGLACVVFLLLMITFKGSESTAPYLYAFERTVETGAGIVVSLLVNRFVFPYKEIKLGGKILKIDYSTSLYCLIGDPVEKSLSPDIHNLSFGRNGVNARYLAFKVEKDELKSAVDGIRALGIKGCNVTIPHKIDIIQHLDELDEEAALLGAVNTVKNVDGKLVGYNTDGRGFVELLKESGVEIAGENVILVGAGGAARGIGMLLAKEGAAKIAIVNRTADKAEKLRAEIQENFPGTEVLVSPQDTGDYKSYGILVNTTSVGMHPNADAVPFDIGMLSSRCAVADIVYKPLKTKLLSQAESAGHKTIEGIGMLINQAVLSEEIWLERKLEKAYVMQEIKRGLSEIE